MKKNEQNPRSFPVDLSLPRWVCQNCHQNISVVGFDSYADKFFNDATRSSSGSFIHGSGSVLGASRMDQSFVVLPKQQRNQPLPPGVGGVPPRPPPPTAAAMHHPDSNHSHKTMEDSYVVLPPPAASVYNTEFGSDGNLHPHSPSPGAPSTPALTSNTSGFSSNLTLLKRAFDVTTCQTQVEQPLCLECMSLLSEKLDKEVEDVKRDIEAYESCLKQLEGEERDVLSESDFLKEKLKVEEEERKLMAEIEETEKQHAQVNAALKELEIKSGRFKELEERYWHEFNNFQFQLTSHQGERDAVLAKIEVSQAHLELLKKTNVLNDAFPIAHDGEFGTINNFRLGRLSKVPVEWDEINAAWGQACLLLHTMCQYFRPKFLYRIKILPMGSYPRIMDSSNNTYELFGPVNLFWSTRYDKAMTLFLTCLKDFAEFANMKDRENNIPAEKCFKLPYKIENDKVENYSITQSFNKQENWTKSLKYTLCNLKWALYWFVGNTNFQPLSVMAPSQAEITGPGSSSYTKHGGNSTYQLNRKPVK
uniref:Autophagy protein 6 n=1 Tax=Kalanchoe fedtschenkoi TaxID=63787 RepID=A0A7N0T4P4_KALFE